MPRKAGKLHTPSDFDLDILEGDTPLFRWFLLCYLFGKPIQSTVAVTTWTLFIEEKLDTPWAIVDASNRNLVSVLHRGGYTRYQHVTADGLHKCMRKLIDFYDGSISLMIESSQDQDEFSKRLQELYGVGPKITEIFMPDIEEIFARRVE
ncbi:MAG: DNA methylase [Candidatus Saccharimonadales bacterium]